MQKIIKPRCPSRQLLETVNFAFMKIFEFLVKIAVFRASVLFCKVKLSKMASTKTNKIIKRRSPSRQLLETVNFAFMKIFDFLVKIAVFRASLLFLGDSRHAFLPASQVRLRP